jgi:predicted ArsR family transcriptional regulator
MKSRNAERAPPHRFSYAGLDRVIHERARLSILASLLAHPQGLTFRELLQLCALTDGNLNRHLQVLQLARLVTVTRALGPGRPQTTCRLTAAGRKRLLEYLEVLEQVLRDASHARQADVPPAPRPAPART